MSPKEIVLGVGGGGVDAATFESGAVAVIDHFSAAPLWIVTRARRGARRRDRTPWSANGTALCFPVRAQGTCCSA